MRSTEQPLAPSLAEIAREWGRIGCVGFGGPPAHIVLLRELCVERTRVARRREFEDAIAATTCCPGRPRRSWRSTAPGGARRRGALVGGLGFICPASSRSSRFRAVPRLLATAWIRGAGEGAAPRSPPSLCAPGLPSPLPSGARARRRRAPRAGSRTSLAGGVAAALVGPWLVLVLLGCGASSWRSAGSCAPPPALHAWPLLARARRPGGVGALVWTASRSARSLRRRLRDHPADAGRRGHAYHWMTGAQFLNAVALGQVTPGPVVQRSRWSATPRAASAAAARGARRVRAVVLFVLLGAARFERLRANDARRAFLAGAGAGGDRRDRRLGVAARAGAARDVAVRAARRRGRLAARAAPRRRLDAARRRRDRRGRRAARRAVSALTAGAARGRAA